jgi:hypothetical protein
VSLGKTEYLSFVLTVVERAHAFDEAVLFEKVEIGLRLMPDHPDSLTEHNSMPLAVLLTVLVLIFSLVTIWYMLPPNIRNLLRGLETKDEV